MCLRVAKAKQSKMNELTKPGPQPQCNQLASPVPIERAVGVAGALRRFAWQHSVTACLD